MRIAMRELPTGTVTFLFTDIEGSTRLLRENRATYDQILADHGRILRAAFEKHEGREIDTQGDSFFAAFRTARDAVEAAIAAQRALTAHAWPAGGEPKVRMGMHTGEPVVSGERYVGLAVHRAARVCAAAHGGQVLLSSTTGDLVAEELPPHARLSDLGDHRLKDFDRPERVFQLVVDGLPADFPPPRTSHPAELPAAASGTALRPVRAWPPVLRRRLAWLVLGFSLLLVIALLVAIASITGSPDAAGQVPSHSVAIIDVATNEVVHSIPLGASAGSLAAFDEAIWVAIPRDRSLVRIDPNSREVTKRVGLGIVPYSLETGQNVLWVGGGVDSTIVRLVPQTEEITELPGFVAPADGYPVIAATEGALWFGENDHVGVRRFEADQGRVDSRGGRFLTPEALAVNDEGVWVVERFDQTVARLDPETGADRGEVPFGAPIPAPGAGTIHEPLSDALLNEWGLWVTDAIEGKVWRIRANERSIQATIGVGRGARAIASGAGSIWVANRLDGTVSRIDPQSDRVVETIKVADRVGGIAVAGRAVWVAVP
jgi:class 3 adenylate cyclase/streptogramin lyase